MSGMQQVLVLRIIVLGLVLFVTVGLSVPHFETRTSGELSVRFLDVGQGDAIHVVTPDGVEVLIDGGPDATVLRELATTRSFFDKTVDVVVATHPDADHVSGLVDVLERFTVGVVVATAVEHDTPAAAQFARAVVLEQAQQVVVDSPMTIQLGASTTLRILAPQGDTTRWNSNAASIVMQLIYGDIAFFLTGDAPDTIEQYLVRLYGSSLESDVLKLGHHGSDTSSNGQLLDAVSPKYAVVSAGADNRYGHPHPAVVGRVVARDISMLETAELGTIEFRTDGRQVWVQN